MLTRHTYIRKRRRARKGPWRSEKYRRFVADHPCVICGDPRTQPAHTGTDGGMSMKSSDASCVPLCPAHHDQLDGRRKINGEVGRKAFEAYHGSMQAHAARIFSEWQSKQEVAS